MLIICLVLLGMTDAVAAPDSSGKPQPQAQPDIAQLQRSIVPDRQNTIPGLVLQDKMPLVPYLEYYIDSSYALDITEASSEQLRDKYELFAPERMPVYGTPGITWLRFVLQPVSEGTQTQAILLDMGSSTPGTPILYTPSFANGALEWQEIQPKGNYFELPRQSAQPIVCYLRVDGIPGFWFSPVLRTVADALSASDSIALYQQSPLVVLAVVFILCLFKGLVEPGQWRLWALLFLAACSVQAWSGLAPATGGYSAKTLASRCKALFAQPGGLASPGRTAHPALPARSRCNASSPCSQLPVDRKAHASLAPCHGHLHTQRSVGLRCGSTLLCALPHGHDHSAPCHSCWPARPALGL